YLVTDQSVLDLGDSRLGRHDAVRPTKPTPLTFNVTNLNAWQEGDHLEFFSTRSNAWYFEMERFGSNPPAVGATSHSGLTITTGPSTSYGTLNLIDGSKGDRGILAQLTSRTSDTGVPYTAMSRVVEFAPFTQVDGTEQVVSGAMVEVATAKSIALDLKGSQYNAYADATGPNLTWSELDVAVQGLAGGNERGMFASSADFVHLTPSVEADLRTGTMTYGTPLNGTWGVSVLTRASFESEYFLPGATGNALYLYGSMETIDPVNSSPASLTITPRLSPVRNPKLNGTNLFSAVSGVGVSPVISWEPPALGTPNLYQVIVRRLSIDSRGNTRSAQVGSVYTRDTQVRMPADLMVAGQSYVLSIAAIQNTASTSYQPYRDTLPSAYTRVNSAIVQMAP
ncbi:hypothetical protein, partial [Archangium sp.]|uniref:hypothetical protein n=1 Tax=Archangium sp. TaxID=1872627 RepID=UPI002EDB9D64